ncbi:wyosine base formation [Candidatus Magnetomorum sp. HK-1]|nr:wyosine base formation [Candidatus Magnetomorum sp. HK-1]
MKSICKDLSEEYSALDAIVADLEPSVWERVTPFFGWTIKDEISHLAYFDRAAFFSASDEQSFTNDMEQMLEGFTDFTQMHKKVNSVGCAMSCKELLKWWRDERKRMLKAFEILDPKTRLPWYGPSMSARSSATARLMETWAHGQDIVDALKLSRAGTDRLKHIAHIGVSTFSWSFKNRKMAVPETDIRVELQSPSHELWVWGPSEAKECVMGSAEDFCLIVTQRRHPDDTQIKTRGEIARKWLEIAQAFAGPPEEGPKAMTFR